jgi:hypothetical protein
MPAAATDAAKLARQLSPTGKVRGSGAGLACAVSAKIIS